MTVAETVGRRCAAAPEHNRRIARRARFLELLYTPFVNLARLLIPLFRHLPLQKIEPAIVPLEKLFKSALFDCRMCGRCILSSTGMSCPMTCPKTMRNGPCGGLREGGYCEIKPDMPCVWLNAWQGAGAMKSGHRVTIRQTPVDHGKVGRSTWIAMMTGDHETGREAATTEPDQVTRDNGSSQLAVKLRSGGFCVTAEFEPRDSADPGQVFQNGGGLLEHVDAVNVTDGAGGHTHISSTAVCTLIERAGHQPVFQISCRDRNRIAIQADALGAAALGITNILCLTGDGVHAADGSGAKPVFDLDCTSLLETLRTMRDEGRFLSGKEITDPPAFFLGATGNPCGLPPDIEVARLTKKIAAGAQFIQTQYCYDMAAFRAFLERFTDEGLHEKAHLLVGVGPLKSAKSAIWKRRNIAGLNIPDDIVERMRDSRNEAREGIAICIEIVEELKQSKGVAGIHMMAFKQPDSAIEILERCGLDRKPV